jgi:UDP-N-acetylmuramoyl-L-alanyl-D-glutamate--2,6-diaminopimelate ligase
MGEVAGRLADLVILTSDNPRSEDPAAILQEIEKGLVKAGARAYELIPDRRAAIVRALTAARKGDIVLIAGKGHETTQEIGGVKYPFDDRIVARDVLLQMGSR